METTERIFKLLSDNGISQKSFAEMFGIKQSTLSNWKNKDYKPTAEIIIKVSQHFKVSADYLYGLTEDPSPNKTQTTPIGLLMSRIHIEASTLPEEGQQEVLNQIELLKLKYNP